MAVRSWSNSWNTSYLEVLVGWLAGYWGEAAMRILPINAWMIFVFKF